MHLEKQVLERRQLEEELEIGEEAQVDELAWMIGSSQQLRYSTDSHSLIQLPPNPISLRILIYIAQVLNVAVLVTVGKFLVVYSSIDPINTS